MRKQKHRYIDTIPDKLYQFREAKGISGRKLSHLIGMGDTYINDIENKRSFPSMESFDELCIFFDVTPLDFFDISVNYPLEINEIVDDLKKLDAEQLGAVKSIVKNMIK